MLKFSAFFILQFEQISLLRNYLFLLFSMNSELLIYIGNAHAFEHFSSNDFLLIGFLAVTVATNVSKPDFIRFEESAEKFGISFKVRI